MAQNYYFVKHAGKIGKSLRFVFVGFLFFSLFCCSKDSKNKYSSEDDFFINYYSENTIGSEQYFDLPNFSDEADFVFNSDNYKTITGSINLSYSSMSSFSNDSMVINEKTAFTKGHISFLMSGTGQHGNNGIVFGLDENKSFSSAEKHLTYYFLSILDSGFISLNKIDKNISNCLTKTLLLNYFEEMGIQVDFYYEVGHVVCYLNGQLFINYYDNNPLLGTKMGFKFHDSGVAVSNFNVSEECINTAICLSNNSFAKYGSIDLPYSSSRATLICRKRVAEGTIVRFVGDVGLYRWELFQLFDVDVDFFSDKSIPHYIESGWNTDIGFGGSDIITTAMSREGFPAMSIGRIDGETLTVDEINQLHSMFVLDGLEAKEQLDSNNLFNYSEPLYGNVFDWNNKNCLSLRFLAKLPKDTEIVFSGDCSLYKWSVIERRHCYETNNTYETKDFFSSKWNTSTDRSNNFVNDYSYITSEEAYLDLCVSYKNDLAFDTVDIYVLYDLFAVRNNNWGSIKNHRDSIDFINHRGYSCEAPENTLAAFQLSKEKGFKKVETDVSETSDGIPVLLHDDTIDRTSNGSGLINSFSFEEARTYDFGSWKGEKYTGEKIPSFDEFISLCENLNLHPYIELKENISSSAVIKCLKTVKKYNMASQCTWVSFDPSKLSLIHFCDDSARLGLLTSGKCNYLQMSTILSLKGERNNVFFDTYFECANSVGMVRMCNSLSIPLETWTINDRGVLNNLNSYISGITTDMIAPIDL